MSRGVRLAVAALVLAALVVAGWRTFTHMRADAAVMRGDFATALEWRPQHPEALLGQATHALKAGDLDAAAAAARKVLQVEPAEGRGYRVLAQVAAARKQPDQARALYRIAVRRAPRDLPSRAWLAQDALERGAPAEALVQVDQVLTLSPATGASVFPVLVQLAGDPGFADALAQTLSRRPRWRAGMLHALQHPSRGDPASADAVLAALQRHGGLDEEETAAWIESLLRDGRWGEAHARWAAPLVAAGTPLPLLYNGDFAQRPSGQGFDWRTPTVAGVILDFEAAPSGGRAAHLRFLGRRIAGPVLEHPLLLPPGRYRLDYRRRLAGLRSDNGLEWTVQCAEKGGAQLARSPALDGTRDWQTESMAFTVPATGCSGQWLRLGNAGQARAGQLISGEAWIGSLAVHGD